MTNAREDAGTGTRYASYGLGGDLETKRYGTNPEVEVPSRKAKDISEPRGRSQSSARVRRGFKSEAQAKGQTQISVSREKLRETEGESGET